MSMKDFATRELELYFKENDEFSEMMKADILEVLETLGNQGHTGMTAPYIINMVKKLWLYKPLTALTGESDEWGECGDGVFQNKRCSAIFKKGEHGSAYYLDGYAYCEPNENSYFTCHESKKDIKFPCSPAELETEYRKLIFPSSWVSIKWANRLHLYRKVTK